MICNTVLVNIISMWMYVQLELANEKIIIMIYYNVVWFWVDKFIWYTGFYLNIISHNMWVFSDAIIIHELWTERLTWYFFCSLEEDSKTNYHHISKQYMANTCSAQEICEFFPLIMRWFAL